VIRQENRERGAARNAGFSNSSGRYVIFFDSDDIMHPNHLEIIHQNILKQNYPDFIATKFDFVDVKGKHRPSDMSSLEEGFYDYKLFLRGNPLACNVCVRRENPKIYFFEEDRRYAIKEDWMYLFQNMKENKLFIVNETTISMLDHPNRSMRSDNSQIIKRTQLAKEWIVSKVKMDPDDLRQLEAHVKYFCAIHSYLDDNRLAGQKYIRMAMTYGGIKLKYIMLAIKLMIGVKVIRMGK
jgi:GalNAc5-diNAcBac-PP-undecaprenol beta-1,3-glucosyltransferase